jgi:hypothetical protein
MRQEWRDGRRSRVEQVEGVDAGWGGLWVGGWGGARWGWGRIVAVEVGRKLGVGGRECVESVPHGLRK